MNPTNQGRVALSSFSFVITSTMTTQDVSVEMFNYDLSVTKIYNSAAQSNGAPQFYPAVGVNGSPVKVPTGDQTTGLNWVFLYSVGGQDAFTSAVKGVPTFPAGTNTRGFVYIDVNGQLVYQPGYVNSVLDAGQVTMQSKQTNYRHVFEVSGKSKFAVAYARIFVGATYTTQLQNQVLYIQQNILGGTGNVPFNPGDYVTEFQQQPNVITADVNKLINAKSGLTYAVNRMVGGIPNVITMVMFFKPLGNMLELV